MLAGNVSSSHDAFNIHSTGAVNVAASQAATLDKGQNDVLMSRAASLFRDTFDTTDKSFVGFHNAARAAHRRIANGLHSSTNAL